MLASRVTEGEDAITYVCADPQCRCHNSRHKRFSAIDFPKFKIDSQTRTSRLMLRNGICGKCDDLEILEEWMIRGGQPLVLTPNGESRRVGDNGQLRVREIVCPHCGLVYAEIGTGPGVRTYEPAPRWRPAMRETTPDKYAGCPHLRAYGTHAHVKGICRYCQHEDFTAFLKYQRGRYRYETYETFRYAAELMLERIPERTSWVGDKPQTNRDVGGWTSAVPYGEASSIDDYGLTGKRERDWLENERKAKSGRLWGKQVGSIPGSSKETCERGGTRLVNMVQRIETLGRDIDAQTSQIARDCNLHDPSKSILENRYLDAAYLTKQFSLDAVVWQQRTPSPREVRQIYAAAYYLLVPDMSERKACSIFQVAPETLQYWRRLLSRYSDLVRF